ncbi:MAG: hypothetical protein MK226_20295 [Saprospiraceae bacterium]|nr:hypothetical protein [Saprospiraceae bacterium]
MQKYIFTCCLLFVGVIIFAQGSQVEFGKNRVQYHKNFDDWLQYESDNFVTYWYGEGRNIAQAAIQIAEYDFNSIQGILEHRVNDKIQIIVYKDLTDLKQSNIGTEEAFTNIGGQTKIVGNKIFVYFDGDHTSLRKQIREGIASVYLNAMLFGSNLQEIVQNAVMMNLPEWFKQGLVGYVGEQWNAEMDNQLRDYFTSEQFENFELLAEENPRLAGQSLWYFIGENYGQSTVSNLLYLTRINRSIESGFLYVLGSPYQIVTDSWALYFKARYEDEVKHRVMPKEEKRIEIKNKRELPISQIKLSPDGSKIVYATNEIGKFKVYLQDLQTGDRQVILKNGFRNAFQATDYNYPLLAWNPNNRQVAILYERRDIIQLALYDVVTKDLTTESVPEKYHRIYSMDYVNPASVVFSATMAGYSDLFIYYINNKQTFRITTDFYDDLDARVVKVKGRTGVLFASNRQDSLLTPMRMDTILPINTFDIWYYDLDNKPGELVRVTNTPLANERNPMAIDTSFFTYLSDQSGVYNREVGKIENYVHHYDQIIKLKEGEEIRIHADSTMELLDPTLIDTIIIEAVIKERAVVYKNSNLARNIEEQHSAPNANLQAELFYINGAYQTFVSPIDIDTLITPPYTVYQQSVSKTYYRELRNIIKAQKEAAKKLEIKPEVKVLKEIEVSEIPATDLPAQKQDTTKVDIDNYLFQSEFDDEEPLQVVIEKDEKKEQKIENPVSTVIGEVVEESSNQKPEKVVYKFNPGKIIPYRLQFRTDYVTTQLDNSLLFEGLESFAANPDGFGYPPPGILLKGNFKDLFEDYEIEGGIRLPTTFNGAEYFMVMNDRKHRLDKRYAIYRRNQKFAEDSNSFVPGRRETNVLLGQFGVRYPLDIFRSFRATATLRRDRFMLLATERQPLETPSSREQRVGLKVEYVFDNTLDVALNIKNGSRYKFFAEAVKRFKFDLTGEETALSFNDGFMTVLGVDARHYQRLGKYSVLALRFAGATSFGSERMLYYLGGVDSWLFPQFNEDIPIPQGGNFAYQTMASNLRGFPINIRNGSSYALFNTELRVPIFKYFSRRLKSNFLRNFQVVGFFDVGTAWEGISPYSDDNPLNTTVIASGNLVDVRVNYFRDPIVAGYGLGVRSVLFGYFVRLDYAWGIETREVLEPQLYISLGTDF